MEKIGAPKKVFLSEDASGIVKRIVYDSITDQLIGIVSPLQPENGCPKLFAYKASSEEEMKRFMELPQSTLVYIIVAQPLKANAPPFIIQLFGTNNKFNSSDVLARWKYVTTELKK